MKRLTVSALRRQNRSIYRPAYSEPVPYIRLSGNWLAAAGIAPGQQLQVELNAGGLQLRPLVREGGAQ